MPTYSFKNIKTGEEFELSMKIAELDPFLEKNKKKFVQIFTKMNLGDPWLLDGVMKPPADFSKYVLGKVKHGVPGATIEQGKYHVTKEV
jgi:hypothetical protein